MLLSPTKTAFGTQKNAKPEFEQVYKDHYFNVFKYINKKIENKENAEDLASEVFLYCYDHYDSYDPEKSSITTWLYMVTNSRLKNFYRDRRSNEDIDELYNVLPDTDSDMEGAVYLTQVREVLAHAISTLSETQQKIVIMSYFQNKTSKEIAEELGMSAGNVRITLMRALDKLGGECEVLRT